MPLCFEVLQFFHGWLYSYGHVKSPFQFSLTVRVSKGSFVSCNQQIAQDYYKSVSLKLRKLPFDTRILLHKKSLTEKFLSRTNYNPRCHLDLQRLLYAYRILTYPRQLTYAFTLQNTKYIMSIYLSLHPPRSI